MSQTIPSPFILAPDTTTEDALLFAAQYLDGAAAIVYETADNSTPDTVLWPAQGCSNSILAGR